MEFFNKIKRKLLISNIMKMIFYSVMLLFFIFLYIMVKTESYHKDASYCAVFVISCIIGLGLSIYNYFNDDRYNELICDVKSIGSVEEVGEMLMSISPSPLSCHDLRFNNRILFYMNKSFPSVSVVRPESVVKITTSVRRMPRGGYSYSVCVHTRARIIMIETYREEQLSPLRDEIIQIFVPHLADAREN